MILVLPYPPSINHYYVKCNRGMYISDRGKMFRKEVNYIFNSSKYAPYGRQTLSISLDFFLPDRRIRDWDNVLKPLFDALQHAGVFDNDTQLINTNHIEKWFFPRRNSPSIRLPTGESVLLEPSTTLVKLEPYTQPTTFSFMEY